MRSNLRERLFVATFAGDAVALIREYGLHIELDHACISADLSGGKRSALRTAVRRDLAQSGAVRRILHGPFTEVYPAAIDPWAVRLAEKRLEQAYRVADAVQAEAMVVHSGYVPFIYFKSWQTEKGAGFWRRFMEDKPAGFRLYVENVLEDEPYMMRDLAVAAGDERIRLCLDTGHALRTIPGTPAEKGRILTETWLPVLAPYIGHLHLHSNDGELDSHEPLGSGCLDMEAFLDRALALCGPETTFTVEASDAAASLAWLGAKGYL